MQLTHLNVFSLKPMEDNKIQFSIQKIFLRYLLKIVLNIAPNQIKLIILIVKIMILNTYYINGGQMNKQNYIYKHARCPKPFFTIYRIL